MDCVILQGVAFNQDDFMRAVKGIGSDDPVFVGAYCVARWYERAWWDALKVAFERERPLRTASHELTVAMVRDGLRSLRRSLSVAH